MNVEILTQQVQAMNWRLEQLYQDATHSSVKISPDLLPLAFKELGIASEELQIALEELQHQNQELIDIRSALEKQNQRYKDLFELATYGFIVTDAEGTVKEANQIVSKLLNVSQRFLIDKPLVLFVAQKERHTFYFQLTKLQQGEQLQDWVVRFSPRDAEPFEAILKAVNVYDSEGNLAELRICICDIKDSKGKQISLNLPDTKLKTTEDSSLELSRQVYLKGETIPLKPQIVYQVCQGIVRLSTLFENGEEVLVGLAGNSMAFGSDLTSLQTYQAVAVCEVHVLRFSLSDILASPHLSQVFIHQVSQRLRQTEALLAISGQRHVKDRLHYLLLLLKQEFGESTVQGTRLGIRLTHQDLADACSTTRVTITRILGKLQEQDKITIDSKNHIILKDQSFQSDFKLTKSGLNA